LAHGGRNRSPSGDAALPEPRRQHLPEQVFDASVHVHRNAARGDQQVAVALAPVEPGTHTGLRTRGGGEGLSLADLALRALGGMPVTALVFLALLPHTG